MRIYAVTDEINCSVRYFTSGRVARKNYRLLRRNRILANFSVWLSRPARVDEMANATHAETSTGSVRSVILHGRV